MLIRQLETFRGRARRSTGSALPTAPLELTGATYVGGTSVTLTFNQEIDASAAVTDLVAVADGQSEEVYIGTSILSTTASSVTLGLITAGLTGSGPVLLTVNEGNGIVPAGGGSAWEGVTELVLPFEA
jgi:hypothetical protein